MARPRKHQGEAFRGWPVRLDTTHGQPRAHRGELTELGIRLCRSWGDMAKRTGRCVSLSLRDGVRANSRLDIVTHTASHPRKKEHHSTGLLRTSALHACAPRARAHSVTRQAH